MPLVQLHIDVRVLIDKVFGPPRRGRAHQLPVVGRQFMSPRSLQREEQKHTEEGVCVTVDIT